MVDVLCVRVVWNHLNPPPAPAVYESGGRVWRARWMDVFVCPEPEHPFGRKGMCLARAWETQGKPRRLAGMLVLDGDVAIDPAHMAAMMACVSSDPRSVWAAPVRLWPASTHRAGWVWAHWKDRASQDMDTSAQFFSFCFTFLPAGLLARAVKAGMRDWGYPLVDAGMSRVAREAGIRGRVVHCDPPVHLHF